MARAKPSSGRRREQERPRSEKPQRRPRRGTSPRFSPRRLVERLRPHKAFLVVLAIALLMRVVTLGRQSLWIDEMCCWNDAAGSKQHILATVHWVVFFLEKASQNLFGPSEFALRLPSALIATAGILFIYLAALQITSRESAFVAALLLTVSPINVYYAQDANYYGMMMGFTAVTLYLLFRFFRTRNVFGSISLLALWLLSNYINCKVHPFNTFIFGAEGIVFVVWFFIDAEFRMYWAGGLRRLLNKPATAVPVLLAMVAVAGVVLYELMPRSMGSVRGMLDSAQGTRIAENFEISGDFFLKMATDYGLVFQDYTPLNVLFTFLFLAFFSAGLVWYALRNRFVLLLTLLAWTLPFAGLYFIKVRHFYHPRYTSFIVPLYVLGAAQGIVLVAELVSRRVAELQRQRFRWLVITGILVILGFALVPNLVRYYTGEKQDWKGAALFLKRHLKPGDVVTSYLFANDTSLQFYVNRLGMDTSMLHKLPEIRGGPSNDLYVLKKMCREKGDVYFCTSYTRYEHPAIMEWITTHFEPVFESPSLHPNEINREGKEVLIYRWKFKDAFVFPPFEYDFEHPGSHDLEASEEGAVSQQSSLFAKQLLFDSPTTYDLTLRFNMPAARDVPLSLLVDGNVVSARTVPTGKQSLDEPFRFPLEPGVRAIAFASDVAEARDLFLAPFHLNIKPTWQGKIIVPAYEADAMHPTTHKWITTFAGFDAFMLQRNLFLRYENVSVPESGRYYFTVNAVHDKPGPVLIEIMWDGKPIGILWFSKSDNSWGSQGFPFVAEAGNHVVTLSFINNNIGSATDDPDEDTDAIIQGFEIAREELVGTGAPDERVRLDGVQLQEVPEGLDSALQTAAATHTIPAGWELIPYLLPFEYLPGQAPDGKTSIRIEMPPFSQGAALQTPSMNVTPGKIFYFSGNIRVRRLENYSANVQILYFDGAQNKIGFDWVNLEGITGTTDWIRLCALRSIPENARWAFFAYVVYPNSRLPGESPEHVEFTDFHFESY